MNGINKISGELYHLVYHSGVRHPRLVAAAHQHLRPAPAHPPQPPGLHRLVRAPGRARRGDPALRRRPPAARLQLRRRRGRRVPARGRQRRGATARSSTSAARRRSRCSTSRELLLEVAGGGSYRLVPFPPERKRIDIGDFYADTAKIRKRLGWEPRVPLRDGLARHARVLPPRTRSTTCERAGPLRRLQGPRGARCARELDAAIARVLDSGWFILGPEVEAFERELARGARARADAVAVANGTDALQLAPRGAGRRAGRRGRHPPLSAAFTALADPAGRRRARCSPTSTRAP